jgi:two-component sensor histidine kinase
MNAATMKASNASVLILAPAGRDGTVAAVILSEVGIPSRICGGVEELVTLLDDAACAVVSEEGLLNANRRPLGEWIAQQPPWSDFPFVVLTSRGSTPDERLPDILGNVTVLERPFHPAVLVNAVRSALRARTRQREVEAHLQERQRTHERQSLLIRELHHRVKNTLATVQGLLGATARSTQSIDEFYHSFSSRIVSLANTHTLLTEDYWQTASLHEILKAELSPYDNQSTERLVLEGPMVELSADLAVPTGMAIHELTTNAAKYGSLSVPHGKVEVMWHVSEASEQSNLRLQWTERGGPPVEKPQRKGFGSTLLQRVLATQCNADINFEFEPEGLRFSMVAPLVRHRLVPKY